MKLTELAIKRLKAKSKNYKVFDGGGLFLFVTTANRKFWRMKYRFQNKENTYSIGEYPEIDLKNARIELHRLKALLDKGEDIAIFKKSKHIDETSKTFKNVCEEWLNTKVDTWSKGHTDKQLCRIKKHLYPKLKNSDIDKISITDVLLILRKLEADNKVESAHRVRSICSQIFRYGIVCGYCETDPCQNLVGAIKTIKATSYPAIIDPPKVATFMKHIKAYPTDLIRNAMLFSAYTFCRPVEVRQAEWSEINFEKEEWLIPAEKMKMRKAHRVPLSKQSIKVLQEMRGLDDKWVFSSPRKGKCISNAAVLVAIRSMGYGKEEMTAHGFRSMASTLLNEQGYRPDLIEKSLAHGDGDKVRAAYNRAEYFEERRVMMQEYADYLDGLTNTSTDFDDSDAFLDSIEHIEHIEYDEQVLTKSE